MTKGCVYLSGPMSGKKDLNFPAFMEAALRLRGAGYGVMNPAEYGETPGWKWEDYIRRDIPVVLTCEAIVTLPGWEGSRGAKAEVAVARMVGMPHLELEEALSV